MCVCVCVCVCVCTVMSDSCDPLDCSLPGSSVHGIFFFRQEYWSELPFPPREDLPNPGILDRWCTILKEVQTSVLCLLHWQVDSLPLSPLGSPASHIKSHSYFLVLLYLAQSHFAFWLAHTFILDTSTLFA